MKIEDALNVMRNYLSEAEKALKNTQLPEMERAEARGSQKAYAHCIGLVSAVLEKKGWA